MDVQPPISLNKADPQQGELISYPCLDYPQSWSLQKQLVQERRSQKRLDTLLLLEHSPVYTVGRSGYSPTLLQDTEIPLPPDVPLYHVERGGSITYHGPGQLMAYPILYLRDFCPGPRQYVYLLEEVIIRTLAQWDIQGRRCEQRPGVWVGTDSPCKIASIGVHISRGVTMHGFALNANVRLSPFLPILPCGLQGCHVTSMKDLLHQSIAPSQLRTEITRIFGEVFNLSWASIQPGQSQDLPPDPNISSLSTLNLQQHSPATMRPNHAR